MARIGLVLGAGGAVGHAFHAGVLAALAEETGWDARDAEVIVGTSAGLARRRVAARRPLAARPRGRADRHDDVGEGRRLVDAAEAAPEHLPPIPARAPRRRGSRDVGAGRARARRAAALERAPGALAAAALPGGSRLHRDHRGGPAPALHRLARPCLWINAVELDTRPARDIRSRPGARDPMSPTAVAASCAIPSFFAPVIIDGVRYVDGGVHSPTNADLVAGLGARPRRDQLADVGRRAIGLRFAPDQPARRLSALRPRARGRHGSAAAARR